MNLLLRLLAVCVLKAGPQDLPATQRLTAQWIAFAIVLEMVYARLVELPEAPPRLALSLLLLLSVPYALLRLRRKPERYTQTLLALAGTGAIFTVLFLPLALFAQGLPAPESTQAMVPEHYMVGWLLIGLLGWKLLVGAQIFRHAMDWPMSAAMLLAVGLFAFELGLDRWLFGAAP
jgi:hypothetical protein